MDKEYCVEDVVKERSEYTTNVEIQDIKKIKINKINKIEKIFFIKPPLLKLMFEKLCELHWMINKTKMQILFCNICILRRKTKEKI